MSDEVEREPEIELQPEPVPEPSPEEEAQVEREERAPHTWGDLRTWFFIGVLVLGAVAHTFFVLNVVGKGILGPDQWNLGWPPTAPR